MAALVKDQPKMSSENYLLITDLVRICNFKIEVLAHHLERGRERQHPLLLVLPPLLDQQINNFKHMVTTIGADRQFADERSLEYKLRNSPQTNMMFKTHFGVFAELLDRLVWALGGNNASSPGSYTIGIPHDRFQEIIAYFQQQLRGPTESLLMLSPFLSQGHHGLEALERALKYMDINRIPGVARNSYPGVVKSIEGQVETKPSDKNDPAGSQLGPTRPSHDDQSPGSGARPLPFSTQPIPQRKSTDIAFLDNPMAIRNAPTQCLKRRVNDKPSQSQRRRKTALRVDKTSIDAVIAKAECE